MPGHCVAANCTNSTILFKFPKEPKRRREWILQVQRTRANWDGPSAYTVLCADHFTQECFDTRPALMASLGFPVQHMNQLVDTAVPSIFSRTPMKSPATRGHARSPINITPKRRSSTSAIAKLDYGRVSFHTH
jgi:hypothetical protein